MINGNTAYILNQKIWLKGQGNITSTIKAMCMLKAATKWVLKIRPLVHVKIGNKFNNYRYLKTEMGIDCLGIYG